MDGSYHDVDSNELSFKTAGRIAFRKAMEMAKPTLLEPVMHVRDHRPRRVRRRPSWATSTRVAARIQGMDNKGHNTIVKARSANVRDAHLRR